MKIKAIAIVFLFLITAACKKDDRLTSNALNITIDPTEPQTVEANAQIPFKANCSGGADITPEWSVENRLGTFDPVKGRETTFTAGTNAGTGKVYATYNNVRCESRITVGGSGCTGSTGGSTGGGGCNNTPAPYFGLFSETFMFPGILLDTDSSRFDGGGALGVWPDGEVTKLETVTGANEKTEGTQALKTSIGSTGGGWWLQFGSDSVPGLSDSDVMQARDMSAFAGGSLKFDVRTAKDVLIELKWGEGNPLPSAFFTLRELGVPLDDQWHSVSIPLSSFTGIDLTKIKIPASFSAAPGCVNFSYYIDNVRWEK